MLDNTSLDQLLDATVYAGDDKVGSVDQIFLDDDTNAPKWATVSTGLFGMKTSFVPIDDATLDGDRLQVSVAKDVIKDAPRIDADQHLSPTEERDLYAYYDRTARYDELEQRVAGERDAVHAERERVEERRERLDDSRDRLEGDRERVRERQEELENERAELREERAEFDRELNDTRAGSPVAGDEPYAGIDGRGNTGGRSYLRPHRRGGEDVAGRGDVLPENLR